MNGFSTVHLAYVKYFIITDTKTCTVVKTMLRTRVSEGVAVTNLWIVERRPPMKHGFGAWFGLPYRF